MVGPTAIAALGSCLPLLFEAVEAFLSTEEALAYGHICCQLVTRAFAEHLSGVQRTRILAINKSLVRAAQAWQGRNPGHRRAWEEVTKQVPAPRAWEVRVPVPSQWKRLPPSLMHRARILIESMGEWCEEEEVLSHQ